MIQPTPEQTACSNLVRLRINIAGAGIGGLTAAIGLRKQGHIVQVFEQGSEIRGVGYGIHLAPNGVGLLRYLGVDIEGGCAVPMNKLRFYKHTGELFNVEDRKATAGKWQNQWFLASRVVLHEQLLSLATSSSGEGEPVIIHTSCKVVDLDIDSGSIHLDDGSIIQGDVIVGADGVNSKAREAIAPAVPYRSRYNCFRMMLRREDVLSDPSTHAPLDETMDFIYSAKTKSILYPTLNNTVYNCVVTHLNELTSGHVEDPKKRMMEICSDHHPSFLNLLSKAAPERFRVWPLYDMETLPTYVKGRLAVIGDAAHPFTPHLAQGGVMAIEDAMSLMVMLSKGTTRDDVQNRLELFNIARHERGTLMQKTSLLVGGDRVDDHPDADNKNLNVQKYLDLALSHDEIHASTQILREWLWKKQRVSTWLQPTSFGPSPWVDQRFSSNPKPRANTEAATAMIKFKTSATLVRNLFPNKAYSFDRPDSVAEATLCIEWGSISNSVALYVHNVQYLEAEGKGAPLAQGVFCPVAFQDSADSICAAREQLGLPVVFSDITITETNGRLTVQLGWRGAEWATIRLTDLGTNSAVEEVPGERSGLLVNKYIPSSGRNSLSDEGTKADANYDLFYPPIQKEIESASDVLRGKEASIVIRDLSPNDLPTLHHITGRLSELPILAVTETLLVKEKSEMFDWSQGRRVST